MDTLQHLEAPGDSRPSPRHEARRPAELAQEALADLADDFDELLWIAGGMRRHLAEAERELREAGRALSRTAGLVLREDLRSRRIRYVGIEAALSRLRRDAQAARPDLATIERLSHERSAHRDLIRTLQATSASLVTATDWQSPSIAHSVASSAGRHDGRVTEHVDDYRRDRHDDAAAFEGDWLREYVDDPHGHGLRAFMTSCGMSAFLTVLEWLVVDALVGGPVVVGNGVYHECRDLVARSSLGTRMIIAPESPTAAFLRTLDRARPGAVFLDTIGNERGVPVPDLRAITAHLERSARRDVHLVVDVTGSSCAAQPFAMARKGSLVRPVVVESVTKYAQLGLDRVTAGMIVAPEAAAERISSFREHLGTNVPDGSVYAIPPPNRSVLERRLGRLDRNAHVIARSLEGLAEGPVVLGVDYPGLAGHPAFEMEAVRAFAGGFLTLDLAPEWDRPGAQARLLAAILDRARTHRTPLAIGASFGLPTTRIYRTRADDESGRPFVRISPGSEHRVEIERVAATLVAALGEVADRPG
jgi:cystathionine beta-lyase/cystathionine gamma-synthase